MKKIIRIMCTVICSAMFTTNAATISLADEIADETQIKYECIDLEEKGLTNQAIFASEGDEGYHADAYGNGYALNIDDFKKLVNRNKSPLTTAKGKSIAWKNEWVEDGINTLEFGGVPYVMDVKKNKEVVLSTAYSNKHSKNYSETGSDISMDGLYTALKILAAAPNGNANNTLRDIGGYPESEWKKWNNWSKLAVKLDYDDGSCEIKEMLTRQPSWDVNSSNSSNTVFPGTISKTDGSEEINQGTMPDGSEVIHDNWWNGFGRMFTLDSGGTGKFLTQRYVYDYYINEYTVPVDSKKVLKNIHIVGSCANYLGIELDDEQNVIYSSSYGNNGNGIYASTVYAITAETDLNIIKQNCQEKISSFLDENKGKNIAEDETLCAELKKIINNYEKCGLDAAQMLESYKPTVKNLIINGTYGSGNTLEIRYDFEDPFGEKDASAYKWYKSKDIQAVFPNEWTVLEGENKKEYTMKDEDDGYAIRGVVIPKVKESAISERALENSEVHTEVFFKDMLPEALNAKLSCNTDEKNITAGSKLTVSYDYFDANEVKSENKDVEENTEIILLKSSDGEEWQTLADLSENENREYTITENDVNLYYKARITPKNNSAETGETVSTNVVTGPFAPIAENVKIEGSGKQGGTLTCKYKYADYNGNAEMNSVVIWYRGNIQIAKGVNYTVKAEDVGYSVSCEVIPCTNVEPATGKNYKSENSVLCSTVSTGGGGGGSCNRSYSNNTQLKPAPVIETPDYNYIYSFGDIQNHWARESIEKLYKKGIISGRDDGFYPDSPMTRAELAAIVCRALNLNKVSYGNSFSDVTADDWFAGYAQALYDKEIISGIDGAFAPEIYITREMAVQVIVNAYSAQLKAPDEPTELDFADKDDVSGWAEENMKTAVANGIINGRDGKLAPKETMTRAEAATIIYSLADKK